MLSQKNINKLCMTGMYKHDPVPEWRGTIYNNNLYHCFNWTFKPRHFEKDDTWYMVDTYFGDKYIELTDDNFDGFEFVFDCNKVDRVSNDFHFEDYDESDYWYKFATDSGGWEFSKSFIKKDAVKIKDKVVERYESEIAGLKRTLKYKEEQLERIKNNEIDLKYV